MADRQSGEDRRFLSPGMAVPGRPRVHAPKIKPNFFALAARACAHGAWVLITLCLLLIAAASYVSSTRSTFDPAAALALPKSPSLAAREAELAQAFPGIAGTFAIAIAAAEPGMARKAAERMAAGMKAKPRFFATAFAPGTGTFLQKYGILYWPEAEVADFVRRARQFSPLYRALASAPDLAGLAALTEQLSLAVSQGRSPVGLDGLLRAAAQTVKGEIEGKPRPLDWVELIVAPPPVSGTWSVIAKPAGDAANAVSEARQMAAELGFNPQNGITVTFAGEGIGNGKQTAGLLRGLQIAGLMTGLITVVLLGVGLGRVGPVLTVVLCSLLAVGGTSAIAALSGLPWTVWSAFVPLIAILASLAAAVPLSIRAGEEAASGMLAVPALMMAGQRFGKGSLLAPVVAFAAAAPLLLTGVPQLMMLVITTGIAMVLVALFAPVLSAALEGVLPEREGAPRYWLDEVIDDVRNAAGKPLQVFFMVALVGLTALGAWNLLRGGTPVPVSGRSGPLHILAAEADAPALAERLAALPEVKQMVWPGAFLPSSGVEKRAALRQLTSGFPAAPAAVEARSEDDLTASLESLKANLLVAESAANVSPELKDAAGLLRRSLVVFAGTGQAGALQKLDRALFGGLAAGLAEVQRLANLPELTTAALDPDVLQHFVAPDGRWRIEVRPGDGTPPREFVAAVQAVAPGAFGSAVAELNQAAGDTLLVTAQFVMSLALVALVVCVWIWSPLAILAALLALAALPLAWLGLAGVTGLAPHSGALPLIPVWLFITAATLALRARAGRARHETALPRVSLMLLLAGFTAAGALCLAGDPLLVEMGQMLAAGLTVSLLAVFGLAPLIDGLRAPAAKRVGRSRKRVI